MNFRRLLILYKLSTERNDNRNNNTNLKVQKFLQGLIRPCVNMLSEHVFAQCSDSTSLKMNSEYFLIVNFNPK